MPALNFQARFAPLVESGEKRQTIRAPRKDGKPHAQPGDTLYLYVGMRTKGCRKLGEARCTRTAQCVINEDHAIIVDGRLLREPREENAFAERDGFGHADALVSFFEATHGLPFHGTLIEWSPTSLSETEK